MDSHKNTTQTRHNEASANMFRNLYLTDTSIEAHRFILRTSETSSLTNNTQTPTGTEILQENDPQTQVHTDLDIGTQSTNTYIFGCIQKDVYKLSPYAQTDWQRYSKEKKITEQTSWFVNYISIQLMKIKRKNC